MWLKKYLGHKIVGLFDGFGKWMTGYSFLWCLRGFCFSYWADTMFDLGVDEEIKYLLTMWVCVRQKKI